MALQDVNITRCIKPNNFDKAIHFSLHHFSDACETSYGMSAYIRLVNVEGVVHCFLLLGKSRVAPLKFISIHRLELTATTLFVKVSEMIRVEIDVHINDEIFWTDNQIVLGYINSDVQRFKTFVANRVQKIRNQTDKRQWHFVETTNILQMMPQEAWSQDIKRRAKSGSKVHHSYEEKNIHGWKNVAFSNRYQMMIPRLKRSIKSMRFK